MARTSGGTAFGDKLRELIERDLLIHILGIHLPPKHVVHLLNMVQLLRRQNRGLAMRASPWCTRAHALCIRNSGPLRGKVTSNAGRRGASGLSRREQGGHGQERVKIKLCWSSR